MSRWGGLIISLSEGCASGLRVEDTAEMGLLDPVDGAAKTAKRCAVHTLTASSVIFHVQI